MSGILYVVGTPIGNLSDFSPRAVETLANVDFVAAEDTRVTLKLLNHFDIKKDIKGLKHKLNLLLNPDIVVKSVSNVNDDFHARLSVKKKEYVYKINIGPFKSSLNCYYYQPRQKLDFALMKDASKVFLGTHDFNNFISGTNDKTVTTIYEINFVKKFDNKIEVHFIGTGFYRYMIRNLMGALLEVGKYNASKEDLLKMLDTIEEKSLPTAPPEGLYLYKVWY